MAGGGATTAKDHITTVSQKQESEATVGTGILM